MRKLLRTAQVQAPWARDLKHELQHLRCAVLRAPFERDFRLLEHFDPPPAEELVDVGANRGQSVQAIRFAHPEARIVCFEPASATFARLRRRVRSDRNVRLHHCGLGAEPGRRKLYTPCYNGYLFDGLASMIPEEAQGWLNPDRLHFFSPSRLQIVDELVPIRRLDDFVLAPCFLKIDVQGGELDVLRGGERTIRAHKPIILLEAPSESREIAFLEPLGYAPFAYDGRRLVAGVGRERNTFLIPRERWRQLSVEVSRLAWAPAAGPFSAVGDPRRMNGVGR